MLYLKNVHLSDVVYNYSGTPAIDNVIKKHTHSHCFNKRYNVNTEDSSNKNNQFRNYIVILPSCDAKVCSI